MMKNAISLLIVLLIAINCNESHPNNYSTSNYPTQSKSEIYTEKLAEIHRLQKALKRKKNLSQSKISQFQEQIASARIEITQQIDLNSNNSYEKAISNQIVNNNLQVIQRADAYIEVFEETLRKIKASEIEIVRIEKFTTVDLIALEGIENNNEFDDLLRKINRMINDIQPNANELVTPKNITPKKSLEEVWIKYIGSENKSSRSQNNTSNQNNNSTIYSRTKPKIENGYIYPFLVIEYSGSLYQIEWNSGSTKFALRKDNSITIIDPIKNTYQEIPFNNNGVGYIYWDKNNPNIIQTLNNISVKTYDLSKNVLLSENTGISTCPFLINVEYWDENYIIANCTNVNRIYRDAILIFNSQTLQVINSVSGKYNKESDSLYNPSKNSLYVLNAGDFWLRVENLLTGKITEKFSHVCNASKKPPTANNYTGEQLPLNCYRRSYVRNFKFSPNSKLTAMNIENEATIIMDEGLNNVVTKFIHKEKYYHREVEYSWSLDGTKLAISADIMPDNYGLKHTVILDTKNNRTYSITDPNKIRAGGYEYISETLWHPSKNSWLLQALKRKKSPSLQRAINLITQQQYFFTTDIIDLTCSNSKISPDGKYIIVACSNKKIYIWETPEEMQ